MLSERFAVFGEELRVGGFQAPCKPGARRFANVNLVALGMHPQHQRFVRRGLQLIGKLLRESRGRIETGSKRKQQNESRQGRSFLHCSTTSDVHANTSHAHVKWVASI